MAEIRITSPEWSAKQNGDGPVLVCKESGATIEIRHLGDIAVIIRALVEYEVLRQKGGGPAVRSAEPER